jgi:spore coat protein U-like protein
VTINHVFHSGEINMMKQLLATSAAVAMLAAAGAASAQSSTANITLNGSIAPNCDVISNIRTPGEGPSDPSSIDGVPAESATVNLLSTETQSLGSLGAVCNTAGNATITFSSANGFKMKNAATGGGLSSEVAYSLNYDNQTFNTNGFSRTLSPNTPPQGTTRTLRFIAASTTQMAQLAGSYTDTVTVTVAPQS